LFDGHRLPRPGRGVGTQRTHLMPREFGFVSSKSSIAPNGHTARVTISPFVTAEIPDACAIVPQQVLRKYARFTRATAVQPHIDGHIP
jgi:hypothetical protein